MPNPDNEPKALAVDLLNEIITYVKQSRPTRTDGSSTQGFVYSQLRVGQMISPRDFAKPWSPIGGSGAATPPAGGQPAPGGSDAARRAQQAAFNACQLVDAMMVVTNDGTLETYSGGGRHLTFAYKSILDAMEAPPPPPRPADEQKRIDDSRAMLWGPDRRPTPAYKTYLDNQIAYGKAIAEFTVAQNRALADPAQADSWPMLAEPFQMAVDQAWDQWKSQGADEIEAALAIVESLGVPLEQGAIADARQLFDAWSVNLAGVATKTPYSYLLPSEWALIDVDDIGWTRLTIGQSDYHSHFEQHGYSVSSGNWRGESSSTSGEGGVGLFGFGFNAGASSSESSSSSSYSASASDGTTFHNDSSGLSIDLEYGLVEIQRPWLLTDLFHLRNWYLRGSHKGVISDGSIEGQAGKESPLLPMIPTHFLVVRNVRISAEHWNSDGSTLSSWYSNSSSSGSSHSSGVSGGVSVPVFGPFSISASASHSESGFEGQFSDESGSSYSNDYGAHWDGQTLEIKGAQIVAWLSEVLPSCPPLDDPSLG